MSNYPTERLPIPQGPPPKPRKRRRRRGLTALIVVLVVLALLVVADRVAASYVENRVATQMQAQGFTSKPSVDIKGFPFLTQLAGRDFKNVQITASGEKAGPVEIDHIDVTLQDVRLNSAFSGGTVDQLNGTGLITFGSLSGAAGTPGLKITDAGNNEVKISVDLGIITGSAKARITKVGKNKIKIKIISTNGLPISDISGLGNTTIPIPSLPLGMTLQSVSVSAQGVLIHITGKHVSFGG